MEFKGIIELLAAGIMVAGLVGIFIERLITKRGIGVRVIQFLAVTLIIPAILILSLEGVLEAQASATLLGTIVGYVLSGIGKDEVTKGPGIGKDEVTKG